MVIANSDFSDVDKFFKDGKAEVMRAVEKVGEEADAYDMENGDYQNQTGTLRKSNRHEVDDNANLTLINDAKSKEGYAYASNVESKGYQVRSGGALFAEKRLKEIFE